MATDKFEAKCQKISGQDVESGREIPELQAVVVGPRQEAVGRWRQCQIAARVRHALGPE